MVKHNNAVPNVHHRKKWQNYIKTWHNQPARKHRRALARQEKVAKAGGRPLDTLKPIVRCCSQKYNYKVRAGRGFSIEELKACKLTPRAARSIGISVDLRRKNKSEEGMQVNIDRLKEYLSRLVVFPKKGGIAKKGSEGVPDDTLRSEIVDKPLAKSIKSVMPIRNHKSILVRTV